MATRPGAFSMTSRRPTPTACSRRRLALAHGIGGIADQRQHAFIADGAEPRLVGHRPDSGAGSIFQSPVWTTVPSGVVIASDIGSGIEWLTVDRLDLERADLERLAGRDRS